VVRCILQRVCVRPLQRADARNIVGALEWAHAYAQSPVVVLLCSGMQQFWRNRGRTRDSLRYLPWAIEAANIGEMPTSAEDRAALDAWRRAADTVFWLLLNYGFAFRETDKLVEAEQHYARCLALARQARERRNEGAALTGLGQIAQSRGRLDEAADYFEQALVIDREVQDRQDEGVDLYQLAMIAEAKGDIERAEELHRESLAIGVEVQSVPDIADSLRELGRFLIQRRPDKREEGCVMLQQAIQFYHEMGLPSEETARETARRLGCGE
jgi:tetratricopeptide (TPR) repeat protein